MTFRQFILQLRSFAVGACAAALVTGCNSTPARKAAEELAREQPA